MADGVERSLSVLFGLAVMVYPGAGALAIAWLLGSYTIVFGVLLLVLGFRLRAFSQRAASLMTGLAS